jgi:hypothetical protein
MGGTLPHKRTLQKFKGATNYPIEKLKFDPCFFDILYSSLKEWGLLDAPLSVSEDGTALQKRADLLDCNEGVFIFGMCGDSVQVTTIDDVVHILQDKTPASTLYVAPGDTAYWAIFFLPIDSMLQHCSFD